MITVSHLVGLLLATPASFAALRRILLHIIASFTVTEILLQEDDCGWENRKYRRWLGNDDKIGRVPNDPYRAKSRKFQGSRSIGRQ